MKRSFVGCLTLTLLGISLDAFSLSDELLSKHPCLSQLPGASSVTLLEPMQVPFERWPVAVVGNWNEIDKDKKLTGVKVCTAMFMTSFTPRNGYVKAMYFVGAPYTTTMAPFSGNIVKNEDGTEVLQLTREYSSAIFEYKLYRDGTIKLLSVTSGKTGDLVSIVAPEQPR